MRLWLLLPVLLTAGCLAPTDDPSQVKDLRVLGVNFEPPELMAPKCDLSDPSVLGAFAKDIDSTWLVEDPDGGGRPISWELRVCANQGDLRCDDDGDFAVLDRGTADAGELKVTLKRPALTQLQDEKDGGTFLLQEVFEQDTFKGLGGLRVPFVMRFSAGEEQVYAQKLFVFSCQFFPSMKPNVNPVLPGVKLNGEDWPEGMVPELKGVEEQRIEAIDFSKLQEDYVVPSFELKPVALTEAWKISWVADLGKIAPNETGGVDLGGQDSRHVVKWKPSSTERTERDVHFTFITRDGRGGQTWIRRTAHYKPQ